MTIEFSTVLPAYDTIFILCIGIFFLYRCNWGGMPDVKKNCLLFTWEKNVLKKTYVPLGSKHSLFRNLFCKTKKTICIENIGFFGVLQKIYLLLQFNSWTKLMIVFHLTLSRANVIIGNIQNLPFGERMLQCVTSIKKITKNRILVRL